MSLVKARERQQSQPDESSSDRSMCCRVHGCTYRWTVDITHGKVCSMHDDFFSRNAKEQSPAKKTYAPMAAVGQWWKSPGVTRDAQPHWQDDGEPF